jgi:RNA polymerase sigma factor (sigma-70 family)
MRRVQAADPEAFRLLYDRLAPAVLALAQAMTHDRRQAEDVAQETFVTAWRKCHVFDPRRGSVQSWLLAITRHRAIDALRRRATRDRPWEQLEDHDRADPRAADPSTEVGRGDAARAVRRAIGALPAEQAAVLTLAYYGQLSQSEIAERAALPLGTVKGRTRAGLRRLAGDLAAYAAGPALTADGA